MSFKFFIPKDFGDLLNAVTLIGGVVFGLVVMETNVSSHTESIAEIKSQMVASNDKVENKIEHQQERISEIEVKLAKIDGKIDIMIEKQTQIQVKH